MIITRVNPEGEIQEMYYPGATVDVEEGPLGDDTIVYIHDSISDLPAYIKTNYYIDGAWETRKEAPGEYYSWADCRWYLDSARLHILIRTERTQLLVSSDWTQSADSPLTDEKKAEWATYRQALRDVPANNLDKTHLNDVVWPTQPS